MKNPLALPARRTRRPSRYSVRAQITLASFAALGLFASQPVFGADTLSATAPATASYITDSNWVDGSHPTATDDVVIDYSTNPSVTTVLGLDGTDAANSLTFGSATGPALGAFSLLANSTAVTTARTLTVTTGNFTFAASNTGAVTIGGTNGVLTLATGAMGVTTGYNFTNNSSQAVNLAAILSNNSNNTTATALTATYTSGLFVVSGASTYGVGVGTGATSAAVGTSTTLIKSGATVRAGAANVNIFSSVGNVNIAGGGTIQLNGLAVPINAVTATSSTAIIENASATNGTLTLTQGSANTAFLGTIRDGTGGGSLSIVKGSGGNALVLTGTNSYTGTTTTSGVIAVGSTGTTGDLGNTSSVIIAANGTAADGTVALERTDNPTFSYTFTGPGTLLAGRGSAATAVTLSGASTFTGSTAIAANATTVAATLSVSSINSVSGGSASSNLGAPTTVANGTITLGGNLTDGVGSLSAGTSGAALSGTANGGGILRYIGTGETTDRVIALNTSVASTATTQTTTGIQQDGATGTLKFTSALGHTAIGTQTLTLQGSGAGEFAGTINDNSTATVSSTATFSSGATTITVTAPTFAVGTTSLGIGSTITGTGIAAGTTITNISGTTYTLSQATTAAGTTSAVTFSGGSTGLTKAGASTWTLSNATGNTYSGSTAINAGTLLVSNTSGSATGSGAVTLGTGTTGTTAGTLASGAGTNGIITGTVTANSTARSVISPGGTGTVGLLTLTTLTTANGATFAYDLGAASASTDHITLTTLNATGTAGGGLAFNFTGAGTAGTIYDLLDYTTGTGLTVSELSATGAMGTFALDPNATTGMEIDFTVAAVPEPSTWMAGLLAVAAVGWSQRKRFVGASSSL